MSTLPIVEMFHSIQGEGTRVGEQSTFIRLAGCNLRCTWCDTTYSWSVEGLRDAVATEISQIAADTRERAVVLTGGEPMLHAKKLPLLISALRSRGVDHITVETNGTLVPDAELADSIDLWSVSPKLPASGESFPLRSLTQFVEAAADRMQLKFVVADGASDYDALWSAVGELVESAPSAPLPLIVQPDGTRTDYDAALRELADLVAADDEFISVSGADRPRRSLVRVIPQVHRVAWGPAARGV